MPGIIPVLLLIIIAAVGSWIPLSNTIALIALSLIAFLYHQKTSAIWQKVLLWLLMVPLAFWGATYRPEGFSYPLLLQFVGADGENSFSLYANFSKGLVGLCLLVFLWPRVQQEKYNLALPGKFCVLLLFPLVIIISAIWLLDLKWQPKLLEQVLLFGTVNLFFTCIAEEAFMRLLLQQPMIRVMQRRTLNRWIQEAVPLLLVTLIFVAIHSGISGAAIWVYALAGFLYGLAYTLSKNILYPIAIHASVNILHFSLLTYPI